MTDRERSDAVIHSDVIRRGQHQIDRRRSGWHRRYQIEIRQRLAERKPDTHD